MPAGNHGSCIHQNKYTGSTKIDEYNYHDSLQPHLIEGNGDYPDKIANKILN